MVVVRWVVRGQFVMPLAYREPLTTAVATPMPGMTCQCKADPGSPPNHVAVMRHRHEPSGFTAAANVHAKTVDYDPRHDAP